MKHVFSIASHLVFYICHKYIELHHLAKNDCVLLLTRNYHIPDAYIPQYTTVISTEYSPANRIWAGFNVIQTLHNKKQFDQLITSHIGDDDFIYYTHVCNNEVCNLMVSKKNCKGYYITEDGSGSYRTFNPQTFVGWRNVMYYVLLKPLFPRFYCIKNHFIETKHPKFKGCIATSQICFPLHQQHLEVIGLPFEQIDLEYCPEAIVSIDPLYLYLSKEEACAVYRDIGQYIAEKHYSTIAYKFHPNFYTSAFSTFKNDYLSAFLVNLDCTVNEIPATVCLENALMTYRSDFYTVFSSVSIYANTAGCTCYSPLHRIKHLIPTDIALVEEISQPI